MITKTELAQFLYDEMQKSDDACFASDSQGMTEACLDGHFDLEKVAEALMNKFEMGVK